MKKGPHDNAAFLDRETGKLLQLDDLIKAADEAGLLSQQIEALGKRIQDAIDPPGGGV